MASHTAAGSKLTHKTHKHTHARKNLPLASSPLAEPLLLFRALQLEELLCAKNLTTFDNSSEKSPAQKTLAKLFTSAETPLRSHARRTQ